MKSGDFVGVCARNAPQWLIADVAACCMKKIRGENERIGKKEK